MITPEIVRKEPEEKVIRKSQRHQSRLEGYEVVRSLTPVVVAKWTYKHVRLARCSQE